MNSKAQIVKKVRDEFDRWEATLSGMSQEQITESPLPSGLTVKDVLAHLWAWQQRSIARLEAALHDTEPQFPPWPAGLDPEAEDVDRINAWIYAMHRERPWSDVYSDWRSGFLQFKALTEAVAEEALLERGRYPWLWGEPLSLVPVASCEHHEEHREQLVEWLRGQPK